MKEESENASSPLPAGRRIVCHLSEEGVARYWRASELEIRETPRVIRREDNMDCDCYIGIGKTEEEALADAKRVRAMHRGLAASQG